MTNSLITFSPHIARRHRAEKRFQFYGILAIVISLGFLALMVVSISITGLSAFVQTKAQFEIFYDPQVIDPAGKREPDELRHANYAKLIKSTLKTLFPDVKGRRDTRQLTRLMSSGAAFELQKRILENPSLIGQKERLWLTMSDDVDMFVKGTITQEQPEIERKLKDKQIAWIITLKAQGLIEKQINWSFLTSGASSEPELAGIFSAFMGSALSLLVCFLLSFPLGVLSAIYLEEFAPKGKWSDFIEVNINNLAAVPSIVFGLLGLAIFINIFGLPRSTPLVGGMVLALMTLPTIIIASRIVLRAVPPSIREAALAIGASHVQTTFHHVVPLAIPGMLTGAIIGMARALGETAPLLMIGMVAFIVDIPRSILDPATALPVQIFLWADSPERAFLEKTCAAMMVLLVFLICMNLMAVLLRKKFEHRW